MLFAIRDLKSGSLLAISNHLPKPLVIQHMAKDRKRHVQVSCGDTKIFDTKIYLKDLEV